MNIIHLNLLELDGCVFRAINAVNSHLKDLRSVLSTLQYFSWQISPVHIPTEGATKPSHLPLLLMVIFFTCYSDSVFIVYMISSFHILSAEHFSGLYFQRSCCEILRVLWYHKNHLF